MPAIPCFAAAARADVHRRLATAAVEIAGANIVGLALDARAEPARRLFPRLAPAVGLVAVAAVDAGAGVRRVGALDAVVASLGLCVQARVVGLAQVLALANSARLAHGRDGRQPAQVVDDAIICVGNVGDAHFHVPGEGTVAHATDAIERSAVRRRLIHPGNEIRLDALAVLEVVLANRGLLELASFCVFL